MRQLLSLLVGLVSGWVLSAVAKQGQLGVIFDLDLVA